MHDYTDYVGRYGHVAEKFAKMGYDFYGMDNRGHGKSEGRLAYFESIDQLVDDLTGYINKVFETFYSKMQGFSSVPPVFLIAHGQGALVVLNFLINNDHTIKSKESSLIKGVAFLKPFW